MDFKFKNKMLSDALSKKVLVIYVIITSVLILNIPIFHHDISEEKENIQAIHSSYEFIHTLQSAASLVKDLETSLRGYLLSGKKSYLEPYNRGKQDIASIIQSLDKYQSEKPYLKNNIESLKESIQLKMIEINNMLVLYKNAGLPAVQKVIRNDFGKIEMDNIRSAVNRIDSIEYNELTRRRAAITSIRRSLSNSIYFVVFLDILVIFIAYLFLRKEMRKRHALTASLQESESQFRTLAESLPQIVWMNDGNGSYIFSNKRWSEITGMTNEQTTSWGWISAVHPDDIESVRYAWTNSLNTGAEYNIEYRLMSDEGLYRWQLARAVPMRGEDGRIYKWFGTSTDIHDYKTALEELQVSEAKIRKIVDSNIIGIVTFTLTDGSVIEANQAFKNFMGFDDDDIKMGISWNRYIDPKFHAETEMAFAQLRSRKPITPCEKEFVKKDGTRIPVMIGAVHLDTPVPTGICFVLDMTERKKALEAIENANRAKSTFLAMMSHEIRTPLGVIAGFADLAMDSKQTASERHNALVRIKKNSELLTELVNDILDLSKIEANKLDIEFKEVETTKFLKDLSESMMLKAKTKGLNLLVTSNGPIPQYIHTDPLRLRQILYNVIGNAIKFTDKGTITLSIQCLEMPGNEKLKVSFFVKDSGIGISEDQRERLFKPFSQAESSTTRKYGGTGLGLVLSQKLATALGGDLTLVSSEPNKGSCFRIDIESIKIDAQKISQFVKKESPMNGISLEGKKILVVEDSLDIQVLVTEYLKQVHAEIDLADNGQMGVEKALANDYDAVLMDISMPIMDGFQATMQLRQKNYNKPVIAMSAHAMNEERTLALKIGFNDYITKPMSRSALIEKLAQFLNNSSEKFEITEKQNDDQKERWGDFSPHH